MFQEHRKRYPISTLSLAKLEAKAKEILERTVQYTQKLNKNEHLLQKNKDLQDKIVKHAMQFYGIEQAELDQHIKEAKKEGRNPDKVSVGQALKHYVRDWSSEGDAERSDAFPCVLNTLLDLSKLNQTVPAKVLVPGSGVGRLGHDIHNLGGEWPTPIQNAVLIWEFSWRGISSR